MTRVSSPMQKLQSLLFPLALALGCFGCDSGSTPTTSTTACDAGPNSANIDVGLSTDLTAGSDLGVLVEYTGDGAYRIENYCDSRVSGYSCAWDVLVTSVDGTVDSFEPDQLEREDFLAAAPSPDADMADGVRLTSFNTTDIDAFTVKTTPGTALRVEAYLDVQDCSGQYVHWLQDGALTDGTSTVTILQPPAE